MRLRLVALTSLVTAIVGAGLSFVLVRTLDGYWGRLVASEIPAGNSIGIGLAVALLMTCPVLASMFVYRHTARKRKTQAVMTGLASLALSVIASYLLGWLFPPPPLVY